MLSSCRVGRLISARGSGLVRAALGHLALRGGSGSSFGLRGRLFFGLVIADREDLQDGVLLAVPLLATVVVPAALLEHGDLVGLGLGDNLGRDGQAIGRLQAAAVAGEQDIAQGDAVARIPIDFLDDDLVSGGDAILLAARAHACEHWLFSATRNFGTHAWALTLGTSAGKRAAYGSGPAVSTAHHVG